jgi:hypothetical protein
MKRRIGVASCLLRLLIFKSKIHVRKLIANTSKYLVIIFIVKTHQVIGQLSHIQFNR